MFNKTKFDSKLYSVNRQVFATNVKDFRVGSTFKVDHRPNEILVIKYVVRDDRGQYKLAADTTGIFHEEKKEFYFSVDDISDLKTNKEGKLDIRRNVRNEIFSFFNQPEFFTPGSIILFENLRSEKFTEENPFCVKKVVQNGVYSYCLVSDTLEENHCYPIYDPADELKDYHDKKIVGYELRPRTINISHVTKILKRGNNPPVIERFSDKDYLKNDKYKTIADSIRSVVNSYKEEIDNIDFDKFSYYLVKIGAIKVHYNISYDSNGNPYIDTVVYKITKRSKKAIRQNYNRFRKTKAFIEYEEQKFQDSLYEDLY